MIVKTRTGQRIETSMVKCDRCGRPFSMTAIQIEQIEAGEYKVRYFSCPYCGEKFHVSAFDRQQEEVAQEQRSLAKKIKLGMEKHFKKRTMEGYRRHLLKITDEARERQKKQLEPIGKRILAGDSLETAVQSTKTEDGGHGQEEGD